MLTMSQINCIRDLSKQGYDISKIHTCTGVDRKTIRKYLEQDDFSPKPPVVKLQNLYRRTIHRRNYGMA